MKLVSLTSEDSQLGKMIGPDQPSAGILAITSDLWDRFVIGEKEQRWVAFGGEQAATWLRLGMQDGRTVVTGMLIWADWPIEVADIRAIPLGHLRDLAARGADDALRMAIPANELDRTYSWPQPTTVRAKSPGRRGHEPEFLDRVLQTYQQAQRTHPSAPMKETARMLNYSVAQARRLVRKANEASEQREEA